MASKTGKDRTDKDRMAEMQQRYLELQFIDQQVKQLQKQVQAIDLQIVELNNTKANIEELKEVKPGTSVLIPLSSGIFFEGAIKNSREFRVNVGADTVIVKSSSETKELIDEQIREIHKVREEIIGSLQELALSAQNIEKELEGLSGYSGYSD